MIEAERDARVEDSDEIASFVAEHGSRLRASPDLLSALGLRVDVANIIDFGPIALSRISAAHAREENERKRLEAMARANFAAQAQTHAAVIDLLESRNHADLGRRVDDLARLRFGLAAGVIALEGPGAAPPGWAPLVNGQVDLILGARKLAQAGLRADRERPLRRAGAGDRQRRPRAPGALGAGAAGAPRFRRPDSETFTADMGEELVSFIARVLERTAERWPAP